jgi:hypothetical protein
MKKEVNLSKNSTQIAVKVLSLFFMVATSIALLYYYREGGIKDSGILETSIRDAGGYIKSGQEIWQGVNPYTQGTSRWGSFAPVVLFLANELIPRTFQTTVIQIVNIAAIFYLVTLFSKNSKPSSWKVYTTTGLVLFSSSFRELLSTNQISASVLAATFLSYHFYCESVQKLGTTRYLNSIGSAVLAALALDLKPHLILPVIMFLGIKKSKKYLSWVRNILSAIFLGHLIIDIKFGAILEIDFLREMQEVQAKITTVRFGDSVTFWPLLREISHVNSSIRVLTIVIPLAIYLILLCLLGLNLRKPSPANEKYALMLALLLPTMGPYFHYYDAVLISVVFLSYLIFHGQGINLVGSVAALILFLPQEFSSFRNILIVILLYLITLMVSITKSNFNIITILVTTVFSVGIYTMYVSVAKKLMTNNFYFHSFATSISIAIMFLAIFGRLKGDDNFYKKDY